MRKLSLKQNVMLFRQLNTYIRSGISPVSYLASMQQLVSGTSMKTIVVRMERAVRRGKSLTEGLLLSRNAFHESHLAMFALGEKTGNLDKVTFLLSEYFERKLKLRRKLVTGLVYPCFLLLAAIFLPQLYLLFTKGVHAYLGAIIKPLFVIMTPVAIIVMLKFLDVKAVWQALDTLKLNIPIVKAITWRLDLASYFRMFALGIEAGGDTSMVAENAVLSLANSNIRGLFQKNMGPDQLVFDPQRQLLPLMKKFPGVHGMVSSGFESGNVPEMMNKAAEYLEDEANTYLTTMVIVIPVLVFTFIAFYIGYIVTSFWSDLYSGLY